MMIACQQHSSCSQRSFHLVRYTSHVLILDASLSAVRKKLACLLLPQIKQTGGEACNALHLRLQDCMALRLPN